MNRPLTFVVNEAQQPTAEVQHIVALVNNSDIRREQLNGREHIVIPSYTLPDDVVMNGGLYPQNEIARSYESLENSFAPIGHPQVDGQYVPAGHPLAVNAFHVGAFNRNVKRVQDEKFGHRVYVEKWVDVVQANQSEQGRALLEAVEKGDPIHTSTGVMLYKEPVANNSEYSWIARQMKFDHDAILLNQRGAATPEQGVGLMVNVADAVLATNLGPAALSVDNWGARRDLLSDALRQMTSADPEAWAYVDNFDFTHLVYSDKAGLWRTSYTIENGVATLGPEKVAVESKVGYFEKVANWWAEKVLPRLKRDVDSPLPNGPTVNGEIDMTPEELKAALQEHGDSMKAAFNEQLAPITEKLATLEGNQTKLTEQLEANAKSAEDDKRKIVAEAWGPTVAAQLTGNALDEAVAKIQPAAPVIAGFVPNHGGEKLADYDTAPE